MVREVGPKEPKISKLHMSREWTPFPFPQFLQNNGHRVEDVGIIESSGRTRDKGQRKV